MGSVSGSTRRARRLFKVLALSALLAAAAPTVSADASVPAGVSGSSDCDTPGVETVTSLSVVTGTQVYMPVRQQTLTAYVDMRFVPCKDAPGFAYGTVLYKRNGIAFGTSGLESNGLGTIQIPRDLTPGPTTFTAEFTNADSSEQPSVSEPLTYRTALVTSIVAVSARGVTLSAADQKRFGVTSGLIVTSTVKAPGSTYVPTGTVHVNIRGKVTSVPLSGGRAVSPVIPAAKGAVTIYSTFEPTNDPTLAIRALGRVTATVVR